MLDEPKGGIGGEEQPDGRGGSQKDPRANGANVVRRKGSKGGGKRWPKRQWSDYQVRIEGYKARYYADQRGSGMVVQFIVRAVQIILRKNRQHGNIGIRAPTATATATG